MPRRAPVGGARVVLRAVCPPSQLWGGGCTHSWKCCAVLLSSASSPCSFFLSGAQVLDFFMVQNGDLTLKLVLMVGFYPHRATLGIFYSCSLEGLCAIGALVMSPSTHSFYQMIRKIAKKWKEGGPELHKNENLQTQCSPLPCVPPTA